MPDSEPAAPSVRPKTGMDPPGAANTSNSNGENNPNVAGQRPGSSGTGAGSSATPSKAMVKYGELVILGYNGQLPQGKIKLRLTNF